MQDREERRYRDSRRRRATMIEKIIVVAPTTAVPMSTAWRGLEGIAAVVFFQELLALFEVGREAEGLLDLVFDVGHGLDRREFEDRLGVVGDRAVTVHRDRHRSHAQEAESDEAEAEDGGGHHQGLEAHVGDVVRDAHQSTMRGRASTRRSCPRPGRKDVERRRPARRPRRPRRRSGFNGWR